MSDRALEHVAAWDVGNTVAGAVLTDIAEHADDALVATTTVTEIADRLGMKPSGVELVLFLAANQRRISAVVNAGKIAGYQLLDGEAAPKPTTLRDLPYDEYLRTGHWQQLRQHKLTEADYRCQVCYGERELEVHHRTYLRLGEERLSDLTVLCSDCHRLFHENGRLTQ